MGLEHTNSIKNKILFLVFLKFLMIIWLRPGIGGFLSHPLLEVGINFGGNTQLFVLEHEAVSTHWVKD